MSFRARPIPASVLRPDGSSRLPTAARRALGVLLICAAYLPAHRLLDPARAGPPAAATRDVGELLWQLVLWGTVIAGVVGALLGRVNAGFPATERMRALADRWVPSDARVVAAVAAAAALALSGAAAVAVFERLPTLGDAMVQLLHARAWAAGRFAAPLADPAAARLVQNGLATPAGWVSVYPPGHTALLAIGLRAGAAWLVGPALTAVTAAATVLAARRLLPERPRAALLGGALVAVSPFVVLLGGGYLSHTSAAAAAAATLYLAARARDGAAAWALAAGATTGVMVLSRPWTGLALGVVGAWIWMGAGDRAGRARRLGLWVLGGAPAALVLFAYGARFFGGPLTLGYEVAFGPAHGLGLHRDPWGNAYGLREAIGYTGFDLMALGAQLFETPVSVVGVVGAWLLLGRALPRGAGIVLAWALVPALANALYWHHGYHLGPRMLYESAPAWCVLAALAVVDLTRSPGWGGRAALWLAALALPAGLLLQLPQRIAAARWTEDAIARATPPAGAADQDVVVFVHGSWPSRVSARLAALGMRRDSIETALRRNDLCVLHRFAEWAALGAPLGVAPPPVDFEPRPGSPAHLRALELAPGVFARVDPRLAPTPACVREARADRLGTLELEPLLWRTPVPGVERGGPFLFRDLGPDENARVLVGHPGARAFVWRPASGQDAGLVPYEDGMGELWSGGEPR